MRTYAPKPTDIERRWYVVDADGVVLGRLASEVAKILSGKHKPIYAPHADVGDHVVVINAKGIRLTGGKENKKIAYRHSGYPGGLTETVYATLLEKRPRFVVEKAVKGMLPKNRIGRAMASKLQVYDGPEHPHQAQKPEPLAVGAVPPWSGLPVREPKEPREVKPKRAARARRSAPEKPAAKTSISRRATAKTSTAKKSTAKRSTAKQSTAKRSTARRAAKKES
jgi:large subunit ribosomal protein L13